MSDFDGEGFAFTFKFRYKLGADIPINNTTIAVGTFFVPISFEVFSNLVLVNQDVTQDRNRTELGIGYRATKDLRLQIRYTLQGIFNNLEGGIRQSDHILRFSVTQTFGFD